MDTPLICSICRKPVLAGELHHTPSGTHYDCKFPAGATLPGQALSGRIKQIDGALAELGVNRRAPRATMGTGGPTRKLIELIQASAQAQFEGRAVSDVRVFLPPPVWRQHRFDVMRVTGSMVVGGLRMSFGSWATVSELIRYRRLFFVGDASHLDMNPDLATLRTRGGRE